MTTHVSNLIFSDASNILTVYSATGGRGGTSTTGNANGGAPDADGIGGGASSGSAGTSRGGSVTNSGGDVTNTGDSSTGGRGGTSTSGTANGGEYEPFEGFN